MNCQRKREERCENLEFASNRSAARRGPASCQTIPYIKHLYNIYACYICLILTINSLRWTTHAAIRIVACTPSRAHESRPSPTVHQRGAY